MRYYLAETYPTCAVPGLTFSMTKEEKRIADWIRDVFRGVELGDGVGLTEAGGLDDYADSKTLADYRSNDEKKTAGNR